MSNISFFTATVDTCVRLLDETRALFVIKRRTQSCNHTPTGGIASTYTTQNRHIQLLASHIVTYNIIHYTDKAPNRHNSALASHSVTQSALESQRECSNVYYLGLSKHLQTVDDHYPTGACTAFFNAVATPFICKTAVKKQT